MGTHDAASVKQTNVGRLYWFREPPLTGAIVEILDVRTDEVAQRQATTFRVLACASRADVAFTVGEVVEVAVRIPVESSLWSLSRLVALDLDGAMREVEAVHLRRSTTWRR